MARRMNVAGILFKPTIAGWRVSEPINGTILKLEHLRRGHFRWQVTEYRGPGLAGVVLGNATTAGDAVAEALRRLDD